MTNEADDSRSSVRDCCRLFFAEPAFLLVQILLTVLFLRAPASLEGLLSAGNPLYALPPHFYAVGVVFLVSVLYGELRCIHFLPYYVGCGLLAVIAFNVALFLLDEIVMQASIAATISGLVYWVLSPRRRF